MGSSETGQRKLTSLLPFTGWQFGPRNVPDCSCAERPKEVRLRATPATGATQANNGAAAACQGQRQHQMYFQRAFTMSASLQHLRVTLSREAVETMYLLECREERLRKREHDDERTHVPVCRGSNHDLLIIKTRRSCHPVTECEGFGTHWNKFVSPQTPGSASSTVMCVSAVRRASSLANSVRAIFDAL